MTSLNYFGDKDSFQNGLASLAKQKREELRMTQGELDKAAGLGTDLPNCAEYEQNPNLMTGWVLSAISLPLEFNIDDNKLIALAKKEIPTEKTLEVVVGALTEL